MMMQYDPNTQHQMLLDLSNTAAMTQERRRAVSSKQYGGKGRGKRNTHMLEVEEAGITTMHTGGSTMLL
jgi:hypothetical protein